MDELEVQLHLLTLTQNIGERSASHFGCFTPLTHQIAGSAGKKASLVVYKK